jgi:hypothetical protein
MVVSENFSIYYSDLRYVMYNGNPPFVMQYRALVPRSGDPVP